MINPFFGGINCNYQVSFVGCPFMFANSTSRNETQNYMGMDNQ